MIRSIYEVLETSVKPNGGPPPLKIKLVVTPSADPEKILLIGEKKERKTVDIKETLFHTTTLTF